MIRDPAERVAVPGSAVMRRDPGNSAKTRPVQP